MPMNLKNYPANWKSISKAKIEKCGNACELCPAENGKPHWKTGSKVVLTVHHINFKKMDCRDKNLLCCCQRCHLRLDAQNHADTREKNKFAKVLRGLQARTFVSDEISTLINKLPVILAADAGCRVYFPNHK